MERAKFWRAITIALLALGLILAGAVVVAVIRFLRISLSALGSFATVPTGYSAVQSLFTVIAIGFLAMSLIQAVRMIFPVRAWFHENQIRRWFFKTEKAILDWKATDKSRNETEASRQAGADVNGFLRLANTSDKSAFFNAPVEQVCGQFGAIAEFLLSEPPMPSPSPLDGEKTVESRPNYLLAALCGPRGAVEAVVLLRSATHQGQAVIATRRRKPVSGGSQEESDVRGRLGYHVHRNIDQLQISIATRWQRTLRGAAMAISFIIAFTVITQQLKTHPDSFEAIGMRGRFDMIGVALVVGLASGYLASVFRDAVAVIERLRRP